RRSADLGRRTPEPDGLGRNGRAPDLHLAALSAGRGRRGAPAPRRPGHDRENRAAASLVTPEVCRMQTDLFSLSNRVAIVTGSARGLGQALAEGLARQGARVVVCDLNQEGARATADRIRAAGGEAVATGVDVADAESCDAMVRFTAEQLGRVDVLV